MITVYTKPSCVQCDATKRLMDRLKLKYETIDITVDAGALDMLIAKGFKGAPVVFTDNDSWAGFQPEKISELVG